MEKKLYITPDMHVKTIEMSEILQGSKTEDTKKASEEDDFEGGAKQSTFSSSSAWDDEE